MTRQRIVMAVVMGAVVLAGILAVLTAGGDAPGRGSSAEDAYGAPTVTGPSLPLLEPDADASLGMRAPEVAGADFDGRAVEVRPDGRPKMIAFLAHWCPHCQREVPMVTAWVDGGGIPDGVDLVAVATGTDPDRANFPPGPWLEREGWPAPVVVDDEDQTVGRAFGLSGYPFWVFLDADHAVVGRVAGSLSQSQLEAIAARLLP